jgi:hypothetical protein
MKGMKSAARKSAAQYKWSLFCVHGGKRAVANDERPHFLEKQ